MTRLDGNDPECETPECRTKRSHGMPKKPRVRFRVWPVRYSAP